ncbi:MAG: Hpt domain-containing protein [bacterium]
MTYENGCAGPAREVIDMESALEQVAGDKDFLSELIVIFINELRKRLDEIRDGLDGADLTKVRIASHKLKGSASNIFANNISCLAAKIELHAMNSEADFAREKFDSLRVEAENFIKWAEKR